MPGENQEEERARSLLERDRCRCACRVKGHRRERNPPRQDDLGSSGSRERLLIGGGMVCDAAAWRKQFCLPGTLAQAVATLVLDPDKRLRGATRPAHPDQPDLRSATAEPEVEPLARLREEPGAGMHRLLETRPIREHDLGACANGVAVDLAALQAESDPVLRPGIVRARIVAQHAEPRGIAVARPEIEVAVAIPIGHREGAAVVREVESGDRRYVGEARPLFDVTAIKEGTVSLAAAPGRTRSREPHDSRPGGTVIPHRFGILPLGRGGRHDLAPEEAS